MTILIGTVCKPRRQVSGEGCFSNVYFTKVYFILLWHVDNFLLWGFFKFIFFWLLHVKSKKVVMINVWNYKIVSNESKKKWTLVTALVKSFYEWHTYLFKKVHCSIIPKASQHWLCQLKLSPLKYNTNFSVFAAAFQAFVEYSRK